MVFRATALFALAMTLAPGPASAAAELPLGPRSLDERRSSAELAPGVRWTRIAREGGPWRVNVLRIDPDARVLVAPAGDAVGERARPSALARGLSAVAAVNGGYFAADGNPAGALAAGGVLVSEPVGGRTALLLGASRSLAALGFQGEVEAGGRTRLLDGVNRRPGLVPACGGRGGDRPTERPDAATTCTDPSELIAFTPAWGARTPRAARAVVVRGGVVTKRAVGGTPVPRDGVVLAGTGDARRFLDCFLAPGTPVEMDFGLRAARAPLAPESLGGIVGGGPRLLSGGRVRVRAGAEGFAPLSAPWFYGSFVAARNPRTLAGVTGRWQPAARDRRRPPGGVERRGDAARGGAPDALARRARRAQPRRWRLDCDDRARASGQPALRRRWRALGQRRAGGVAVIGAAIAAAALAMTAGGAGQPEPRAIVWAVGDGADGSAPARRLARMIERDEPDAVLYLGDVYPSGTAEDYERNFEPVYGRLASIMWPTAGNHEWGNREVGYYPYWRQLPASAALVSLRARGLGADGAELGDPTLRRLEAAALARPRARRTRDHLSACVLAPPTFQRRDRPRRRTGRGAVLAVAARPRAPGAQRPRARADALPQESRPDRVRVRGRRQRPLLAAPQPARGVRALGPHRRAAPDADARSGRLDFRDLDGNLLDRSRATCERALP